MNAMPEAFETSGAACPVVVVPCFNEVHRLNAQAFLNLARSGKIRLLFVDDGSSDGTGPALEELRRLADGIAVLHLPQNMGKAEAVRRGLQRAIDSDANIVGYFDADLSTPGSELIRMTGILAERPDLFAVFGSRVAKLGSHIRRSPLRHYSGRVFATFASIALGVPVYDTQCGAKVFRVNDTLIAALRLPFPSAWSFDVVLCQRLFDGAGDLPGLPVSSFLEMPLEEWTDFGGSKMSISGAIRALWDVLAMSVARYTRGRAQQRSVPKSGRSDPSGGESTSTDQPARIRAPLDTLPIIDNEWGLRSGTHSRIDPT
jgi:glycosyltransferase involved in cell wall biosynthesis